MLKSKATLEYEKSMLIKSYGIDYSYLKNNISRERKRNKENETRNALLELNTPDNDFEIHIVENLDEYQKLIAHLTNDPKFPIFYRGQNNANYLLVPSALRGNTDTEHLLIQEFCRRFPDEIKKCDTAMEKLVLMQHYGLHTRCLDITEAPLPALYFACADFKKFATDSNMDKWGEILLFHALNEDDQKYPDSNTVSIMANTAFLKSEFSMKELEIRYKQDNHLGALDDYIYLKHVLKHSVIVRTAQNNPRIKNQQGAFILVNANYCKSAKIKKKNSKSEIWDEPYLFSSDFEEIMDDGFSELDYIDCLVDSFAHSPMRTPFYIEEIKNVIYKKSIPYDQSEYVPDSIKKDPFDINRLFYRNKDGKRIVILIPPYAKKDILEQLALNNIREDFIYPDMDTVSNELNNTIGK